MPQVGQRDEKPAAAAPAMNTSQDNDDDDDQQRQDRHNVCPPTPSSTISATSTTGHNQAREAARGKSKSPANGRQNTMASSNEDDLEDRTDYETLEVFEAAARATDNSDSQVLLYSNREPLKLKEFSEEVRALMDVEQFAYQAELLLLDATSSATSIEDIVDMMALKVGQSERESGTSLAQNFSLSKEIFVPGSSILMARTIQGARPSPDLPDQLENDQSWLCAMCTSAQVNRRHMVITRFKQPINMGANAHQVKLFVLIVTPTREKGTKSALETGRTFATLLANSSFRQRLLESSDEIEFKTLMVIRAQQLSRSRELKNRHKYMFDAMLHESITELNSAGCNLDQRGHGHRRKLYLSATMSKLACVGATPTGSDSTDANGDGCEPPIKFSRNPEAGRLIELMSAAGTLEPGARHGAGINQSAVAKLESRREDHKLRQPSPQPPDQPKAALFMSNGEVSSGQDKTKSSACLLAGLCAHLEFGRGLWDDLGRRVRCYPSDFRDAFVGPPRTLQKTVATIWFLYFGILLPTIAFSSLNTTQTHGHMGDLRKAIIGQAIGGLGFALFGGQPLVIIMTTAPLCLYTKVIHQMCLDYGFHFPAMYAAVGLWNGFFLTIYSLFGFSKLMRWCTRSTEEIFALFIVIAFITDAGKDLLKNFHKHYYSSACKLLDAGHHLANQTAHLRPDQRSAGDSEGALVEQAICRRETSLLFVLLMLGTLWLSVSLYKFKKTPYLSAAKRELLADYALPSAVMVMSFLGSFVFGEIYVEKFPPVVEIHFERAQVELLPLSGLLTSLGLGFTLSLLFFMDQNISAAMVNAPQNRLKKGCAYHYDLLVVGVLNGFLAAYGLPMMHGVLPHSPLHVRSLSDIGEQMEEGHLRQVVSNCRETRVTSIVAHILLLASLMLIPYPIAYIPRAVLNGLFLYMAVTSLDGLQIFERILLLFTEQSNYPPNHYIRRCPQRKIHKFTFIQLLQLLVMCLFGFSPINIIEMFFPVIILLMIPFRYKVVPKYLNEKFLDALDGRH